MTREERLDWLCRLRSGLVWFDVPPKERPVFEQVLSEVIKALEQEPCEDAVSRKAVVELVEGWWLGHTKEDDLATEVKALPSVTPTPKKGKWIYNEKDSDLDYLVYSCSVCGRHVHIYLTNNNRCIEDYPYCHCGAYMKGEKE